MRNVLKKVLLGAIVRRWYHSRISLALEIQVIFLLGIHHFLVEKHHDSGNFPRKREAITARPASLLHDGSFHAHATTEPSVLHTALAKSSHTKSSSIVGFRLPQAGHIQSQRLRQRYQQSHFRQSRVRPYYFTTDENLLKYRVK